MTTDLLALSNQLVERRAFRWEAGMRGRWPHGESLILVAYNPDCPPAHGYVPDLTHRPTAALLAVQAVEAGCAIEKWGSEWSVSDLRHCDGTKRHTADTLGEAAARALLAIHTPEGT